MVEKTRKCYIVSVEVTSDTARTKLLSRLKEYKGLCPINRHCWAILTEQKATEVRDDLAQALEATDRIFVIRSGTEAAWRNTYGPEHTSWLKKYL